MKRRIAALVLTFLVALGVFSITSVSYAAEETNETETTQETKAEVKMTEVDHIRLDIYYSGEVEVESDTKGVEVDHLSGSKKRKNEWTSITVTVTAEEGYVFKRLNRSSAWKLYSDSSDLKVKFDSVSYGEDEAKLKFKYYLKDDTVERSYNSSNNSSNYSGDYFHYYNYEVSRYYDGWQKQSGYWYYYERGYKVANTWRWVNGVWYYFDSNGRMKTGWLNMGNNVYFYLDPSSGAMVTGWRLINNSWYFFAANGEMVRGWLQDGYTWYFLGDDGKMLTGWYTINGSVYHFKENSPGQGMLIQ